MIASVSFVRAVERLFDSAEVIASCSRVFRRVRSSCDILEVGAAMMW